MARLCTSARFCVALTFLQLRVSIALLTAQHGRFAPSPQHGVHSDASILEPASSASSNMEVQDLASREVYMTTSSAVTGVRGHQAHAKLYMCTSAIAFALLISLAVLWEAALSLGFCKITFSAEVATAQACSIMIQLMTSVDFSVIIPGSLDLADAMGQGPAVSGVYVGLRPLALPLGSLFGRLFVKDLAQHRAKQIIVLCLIIIAFINYGTAALLSSNLYRSAWFPWLIFGMRFLGGLPLGVIQVLSRTLAIRLTSKAGQVSFSVLNMAAANAGYCLGPLVSSFALSGHGVDSSLLSALSKTALPLYMVAIIWAALACVTSLVLPRELSAVAQPATPKTEANTGRQIAPDRRGQARFDEESIENRKTVVKACGAYTCERGFTVGAVEVATTMLLQTQYGWSTIDIGFGYSVVAAATTLLGLLFVVVQSMSPVSEMHCLMAMSFIAFCSVALLFDFNLVFNGAQMLIFADAMIYAFGYIGNGITDGFVFRAAVPDTPYCLETWMTAKLFLSNYPRALAAPLSRGLISHSGRNVYATMQLVISLLSLCSVWKLWHILANGGGHSNDPGSAKGGSNDVQNDTATFEGESQPAEKGTP